MLLIAHEAVLVVTLVSFTVGRPALVESVWGTAPGSRLPRLFHIAPRSPRLTPRCHPASEPIQINERWTFWPCGIVFDHARLASDKARGVQRLGSCELDAEQ
jgi:hypothetical protein